MHDQKVKSAMDQGDQLLNSAEKEMFRSEEDVVPFMACSSARQAIGKYLNGFLLKNGVENEDALSLDALLNQCIEIDPRFEKIKMDKMFCSSEKYDTKFCTDLEKVKECVQLAFETKKVVVDEIWPLSKKVK